MKRKTTRAPHRAGDQRQYRITISSNFPTDSIDLRWATARSAEGVAWPRWARTRRPDDSLACGRNLLRHRSDDPHLAHSRSTQAGVTGTLTTALGSVVTPSPVVSGSGRHPLRHHYRRLLSARQAALRWRRAPGCRRRRLQQAAGSQWNKSGWPPIDRAPAFRPIAVCERESRALQRSTVRCPHRETSLTLDCRDDVRNVMSYGESLSHDSCIYMAHTGYRRLCRRVPQRPKHLTKGTNNRMMRSIGRSRPALSVLASQCAGLDGRTPCRPRGACGSGSPRWRMSLAPGGAARPRNFWARGDDRGH